MQERITFGRHDVTDDVVRILSERRAVQVLNATKQLEKAAKAGRERFFLDDKKGSGGHVKMMIPPVSYHYWGQRLGYKCWQDKQFCAEFLRDNPAARVISRSKTTKVSLAERGIVSAASINNARSRKSYGVI